MGQDEIREGGVDNNPDTVTHTLEIIEGRNRPFLWIDKEIVSRYLPKVGASAICVYLGLLYHENGATNQCFPSQNRLSNLLGISKGTIKTAIKALTESGLISYQQRTGPEEGHQSHIFTILDIFNLSPTARSKFDLGARSKITPTLGQNLTPNKTKRTRQIKTSPIVPEGDGYSENFIAFWACYPTGSRGKAGKGAAYKSWKRLKLEDNWGGVFAALERLKKSEQWKRDGGQYIPNPATWLNRRGWEDELPEVKAATPRVLPGGSKTEAEVYKLFQELEKKK